MAHLKGKDDDIDIDYLLETLSPEELEKLGEELIDPDVIASCLCEKFDLRGECRPAMLLIIFCKTAKHIILT